MRLIVKNNHGQALVEYVLLLVVSVTLILSLSSLIFKPFQQFVKSVMGNYVECLLETGELPQLGFDDGGEESECQAKFRTAQEQLSKSMASAKDKSKSGGKSDHEDKSNSNNALAAARGRGRASKFDDKPSVSAERSGAALANSKKVELALSGESDGFFKSNKMGSTIIVRKSKRTQVAMGSLSASTVKKIEEKAVKKNDQVISSEEINRPTKKIIIHKEISKPQEKDEEPLTFGSFIRILLFAAIIITLLLLIGGQALQLSKSD